MFKKLSILRYYYRQCLHTPEVGLSGALKHFWLDAIPHAMQPITHVGLGLSRNWAWVEILLPITINAQLLLGNEA